eukprot:1259299-Pleurochrysis_carterae.AAC.4
MQGVKRRADKVSKETIGKYASREGEDRHVEGEAEMQRARQSGRDGTVSYTHLRAHETDSYL